jgi:hypothetical protein
MNYKFGISLKMMQGIEWALIFVFGFMVIRKMNPVWLLNTEIFMPVAFSASTALYTIYTVLITGFLVIITILFLISGIVCCSEVFIKSMLKDMTTDKIEKLKIKRGRIQIFRSIIEDILLIYFSWVLEKYYLSILMAITAIESRWLLGVYNQIADTMKVRFYDDLQKEVAEAERAEFENDPRNDLFY